MRRAFGIVMGLALGACGSSTTPDDAGVDSGTAVPGCGDGVLQSGEECDDGNDEAFDGCEPTCTFTCSTDADCDDGNVCTGAETCPSDLHFCAPGTPPADGTECDAATMAECFGGRCVGPGCGNGVLERGAGEECDDGPPGMGNDGDGCTDTCSYTCEIWDDAMNVLGDGVGGFESTTYRVGWDWPDFSMPGWYGDESEIVGIADGNGVDPVETRMLHFITSLSGGPGTSIWGESAFLVDLAPFASQVATGRLRAHLSAHFNRSLGAIDDQFNITLRTRDADRNILRANGNSMISDAFPDTWECVHVDMLVPAESVSLRVKLAAVENLQPNDTGTEFEGHFADSVALWFVMDP